MGGFQFNGCGAKDYFKKVKYLGEKFCPNCKKIAPFYLEKGKFKVSVFWIPTVTLKERYAIMCERCEGGQWIEDSEAYKILSDDSYTLDAAAHERAAVSAPQCPRCGAPVDGKFCGTCGAILQTTNAQKHESAGVDNTASHSTGKRICTSCGSQVEGLFCGTCGTRYVRPSPSQEVRVCRQCGTRVEGAFCSTCGTKYQSTEDVMVDNQTKKKYVCSSCGAEVEGSFCGRCGTRRQSDSYVQDVANKKLDNKQSAQEWECSLCGTKNSQHLDVCSLCGCAKKES